MKKYLFAIFILCLLVLEACVFDHGQGLLSLNPGDQCPQGALWTKTSYLYTDSVVYQVSISSQKMSSSGNGGALKLATPIHPSPLTVPNGDTIVQKPGYFMILNFNYLDSSYDTTCYHQNSPQDTLWILNCNSGKVIQFTWFDTLSNAQTLYAQGHWTTERDSSNKVDSVWLVEDAYEGVPRIDSVWINSILSSVQTYYVNSSGWASFGVDTRGDTLSKAYINHSNNPSPSWSLSPGASEIDSVWVASQLVSVNWNSDTLIFYKSWNQGQWIYSQYYAYAHFDSTADSMRLKDSSISYWAPGKISAINTIVRSKNPRHSHWIWQNQYFSQERNPPSISLTVTDTSMDSIHRIDVDSEVQWQGTQILWQKVLRNYLTYDNDFAMNYHWFRDSSTVANDTSNRPLSHRFWKYRYQMANPKVTMINPSSSSSVDDEWDGGGGAVADTASKTWVNYDLWSYEFDPLNQNKLVYYSLQNSNYLFEAQCK